MQAKGATCLAAVSFSACVCLPCFDVVWTVGLVDVLCAGL